MKCNLLPGLLLLIIICATVTARAQEAKADTAFLQRAKTEAAALYQQAVGKQAHLYNGPEYVEYRRMQLKGHPFFETDKLTEGDVFYDGAWFRQVPIRYDVITDEVMVSNGGALQKLVPGKLASFVLAGHTFVRLGQDSLASNSVQPGYYDLLLNEEVAVVAKRAKLAQERVERGEISGEYELTDKYYIRKENTFYPVNSKATVLAVFKDKRKQVRKHLSARKLNFNKQKEAALIEAARYYTTLSD